MRLPIKWLKEYVDTKLSAEKIADKLTMVGLEVDEIVGGQIFTGVVVGHVLSVEKHPNADKLNVASVDVGEEKLQIVCGATNLRAGQKVPVALVGAKLGDYDITKATLRGVDSYGMICSERELGISDEHAGIMVLAANAKPGFDVALLLGSDKALDVKVLANRPDCMSVIGLAREVAVATGTKFELKTPSLDYSSNVSEKLETNSSRLARTIDISVENSKLCPRYMARFVTGLEAGNEKLEAPAWMKERLTACGIRPISLYVDISNYVMLEYGQPLHFFDYDKLKDKNIVVRSAKAGEEIVTLDGTKRKLTKDNLVIANTKSPIAIAGVMGGADTEIDENTENILIEAAVFDKASIRKTSRALGLRSEAVARFEKGIALTLPEVAINRAVQLLSELGNGIVSKSIVDVKSATDKSKTINFDINKMNSFLGTAITEKDALGVLTSLGFDFAKEKNDYAVKAPYWRTDIVEDVDVYEEIIRIVGYDKVPYTLPYNVKALPESNKYYKVMGQIRSRLSAIGFYEILTYSFIGAKELNAMGIPVSLAPEIQNPLVSDQQYLRPTLVPKMLSAICENQYNKDVLHLFEIGKSFEKTSEGKLPKETNWLTLGFDTDFFDAKGAIYNLLDTFNINEDEMVVKPTTSDFLKKGIGADIFVQGKRIASIGEIREEVREKFDIKRSVTVGQLNLDVLLELESPEIKFVGFSKYQRVIRDLSAVFTDSTTVAEIKQKLARANKLITNIEIVDIYRGKGLSANEKSITIRFFIQSEDHTLTDAEVDETMKIVHNKITEIGGKQRIGS